MMGKYLRVADHLAVRFAAVLDDQVEFFVAEAVLEDDDRELSFPEQLRLVVEQRPHAPLACSAAQPSISFSLASEHCRRRLLVVLHDFGFSFWSARSPLFLRGVEPSRAVNGPA